MSPREACQHVCDAYPYTTGYLIVVLTVELALLVLHVAGVV